MKKLLVLIVAIFVLAAACGSDSTTVATSDGDGSDDNQLPINDGDEPVDSDGPVLEPGDADAYNGDDPLPLPDEPLGAGPYPIADLTITYDHPDTGTVKYQVVCLGDTATLLGDVDGVRDQSACMALANDAAQARLINGVPTDQVCTEIYGGPETAKITGTLDGNTIDTDAHRNNGCGIDDWDNVLTGLLPPPRQF